MKKFTIFLALLLTILCLTACGKQTFADGIYSVDATLQGGTGKASIVEATVLVKDNICTATIRWSSKNYDFMVVNGETITPDSIEDGSVFTFAIPGFGTEVAVQADTVAMGNPHLIDYTLVFSNPVLVK